MNRARAAPTLSVLIALALTGCVDEGGPHPETPLTRPPDRAEDGGVVGESPDNAQGGAGGAGGAGGDETPPECMDAGVEGGWDDEDAGALHSRSR